MAWFMEESGGRRYKTRRANRRLGPRLDVKTHVRGSGRGGRPSSLAMALLIPGAAVTLVVLVWLGVRTAGRFLFSGNPVFTINRVVIGNESPVTAEYIRGKQGIREGSNLFAFNIRDARAEFLRSAPNFKQMEITRIMPDTVTVEVTERVPLARVGKGGGFVVDAEKFVFGPKVRKHNLPVITGYKGPLLRPGSRIGGTAADAVALLRLCDNAALGEEIVVREIDVSGGFAGKDDDMRLSLAGRVTVDLWWPRQGPKGYSADDELRDRLLFLRGVLRRARQEGREVDHVNLTLESYKENTAVTYRE